MQVNNLTMDMGTTVGWSDTMIKNISFTPFEWARFADAVNQSNAEALRVGLIIGAIAGVLGFVAAIKVMEWKGRKDGET
jgi:hypothetical protein